MEERHTPLTVRDFASDKDYANHLANLETFRKALSTKTLEEINIIERFAKASKQIKLSKNQKVKSKTKK